MPRPLRDDAASGNRATAARPAVGQCWWLLRLGAQQGAARCALFFHGIAYQLLHASMFYGDECAISMVPGRGVLCASLHAGAGQTGRRALPSQPSAPKLHHCQALPLLA